MASRMSKQKQRAIRREQERKARERQREIELSNEQLEEVEEMVERAQGKIETLSKQPRFSDDGTGYTAFYRSLEAWLKSCEISLPEYDAQSMERDQMLREVWRMEPHWAGMVYQANLIDSNRGWEFTGGRNQVRAYTNMLHNANNGDGWRTFFRQQALSFRVTDMCTITELERDQDARIVDGRILLPPLRGINHVDSARCQLTGKQIDSLDYYPAGSNRQTWKIWDYFRSVSSPSDDEAMRGLGYCATSRAIDLIKLLYGVLMHDEEQLGARMPKGILFLHNISDEQWRQALEARSSDLDGMNRQYYGGVMILGSTGLGEQDAKLVALSSLPTNFNREIFIDQTIAGMALCLGYELAEFWPAKAGVLGRGKETEVQHRKATTKGTMEFATSWQERYQRQIPQSLLFEFQERDDEGELLEAEVEAAWIDNATKMYESGLKEGQPFLSWAEARSYAVDKGVIPSEWTEAEEDVKATDTDESELERLLDTTQVRRAIEIFGEDDIIQVSYDPRTNRFTERDIRRKKRFAGVTISRDMTSYEKNIRGFARALRRGAVNRVEFFDAMEASIKRNFTNAWHDGAKDMGFTPDEFDVPQDTEPLDNFIGNESNFIFGFADWIISMRDKPASALEHRIMQWAQRWREIKDAAVAHFGKNRKLLWRYDPAKESCDDCARLNGQVRRAKFWSERGLHPLSMQLQCGPGRQCGCVFEETSEPITKGRLPKIAGPA